MSQSVNHVKEIQDCHYSDLTNEILMSSSPVVLRGLISDWPLVKKASQSDQDALNYLRGLDSHKPVQSFVAPASEQGRYFYNDDLTGFNFKPENTTLTSVLNTLEQGSNLARTSTRYIGSTSVDYVLPGFRQDNDVPPLKDKPLISIWVGDQSRIAAHFDVPDNLACVAMGKRRFTLFPPNQLENLYIGPLDFTPAGQPASMVDFCNPDFEKFPKFREALNQAQIAELGAGDAIFIPSMWWHHVEGLDNINVLVNYWWRQVEDYLSAPFDALNHALLSIRDLPQSQRDAWRNMFEHYVFAPDENAHIPVAQKGSLNPIDELTARKLRAMLLNKLNR